MNESPETDLDRLPDDPQILKRLLARQAAGYRHLEQVASDRDKALQEQASAHRKTHGLLREKEAELKSQSLLVEKLKHQLALLKRRLFGTSSEKLRQEVEQLELLIEDLETDLTPSPASSGPGDFGDIPAADSAPARQKPVRLKLPEHLPREDRILATEGCCTACGGELHEIGEDVLEQLEYVPASFKVIRFRRPKKACRSCGTVVQSPAPDHAIERGKAGPGLLAHVLIGKYMDHLPLYRQSEIYEREGILLPRSTMADWVGRVSRLLMPLYEALERHVMSQNSLHGDDTPVPVLEPGKGRTRTGRLWSYVYDGRPRGEATPPAALFYYSPDRKGEHPQGHLEDYTGLLHADGYAGFDKLYRRKQSPIREVACWAHVRRKFFDLHQAKAGPVTARLLELIGALYEIEREVRDDPPEQRLKVRQERAAPILKELHHYLTEKQRQLPRKSNLAGAIAYALKRWQALIYYIEDGRAEIDNNAAERSIRPVAPGKKNWLFCGSDKGGERAAMIYSLLESAKMNGVNAEVWLTDVLARITAHPINRVEEFLPWNWNSA